MLEMSVRRRWLMGIAVIGVSILPGNRALAQITPDGTLPNNSIVTPNGNTLNITGGTQAGTNLFHSFREFSVPTRGTAFFNNAVNIQNIISRVTGGSISNIDGSIGALGSANVFLINSNGIVFGQNASLNVGGSFVASTASAIQFGFQGFFSATNPDTPQLLTINPSALFFNQRTIAGISNSSVAPAGKGPTGADVTGLRVPDGQSLLLVGGDVNLNGGSLRAYGGRVELAGLAAPGVVGLNVAGNTFSLSIPQDVQRANVSLSNGAEVNVRASDGGSIAINAQNVNLTGGSKLRAGIESGLGTQQSKAGDIEINATGETVLSDGSLIANVVNSNAVGSGGNINVSAASLSLKNGAELNASTFGKGDAGNVIIDARGNVSFDGTSSGAFSTVQEQNGVGKGGDVRISADSLSVTNGAELNASTFGKGDAGNVIIDARGQVTFDGTSSGAFSTVQEQNSVGKGGDVRISADSLSVTNGAGLTAATRGKGDAGNVIIDARGQVTFDGTSSDGKFSSGAFSRVEQNGVGKGGDVRISADSLSFTNGAALNASTFGKGDAGNVIIDARRNVSFDGTSSDGKFSSGAFSTVEENGVGKGGDVRISADSLSFTNGAALNASTFGKGDAGNVIIDARRNVSFDGTSSDGKFSSGAFSTVEQNGVGKGGNVRISADSLSFTNGAELNASTFGKGDAGNVIIDARGQVTFDGTSSDGKFFSGAFSRVEENGVGKGGDVRISADSLSFTNGAELNASTFGKGDAGNVIIDARRNVSFDGTSSDGKFSSGAFSTVEQNGVGKGGDIHISADSLSFTNGAALSTSTFGKGDAGNVIIDARRNVSFDGTSSDGKFSSGAFSIVEENGVGKGGDVRISADSLSFTNGAALNVSTVGKGDAGNVIIDARRNVSFDGTSSDGKFSSGAFSTVEENGVGKGGDVRISADSLSVTNGAGLSASIRGKGDAGNVIIDARGQVTFDGTSSDGKLTTGALSTVEENGVGKGGDVRISADSLSVTNGAGLTASTFGKGDAGNVIIDARGQVTFDGTTSYDKLTIGAFSTVEENGVGKGGDVRISADSLSFTNGAQLTASTFGKGDAGNVIIDARGNVSFDGTSSDGKFASGAFSIVEQNGVGKGGDVRISADSLSFTNGARLSVSTFGKGDAGNVIIDARGNVSFDGTSSDGKFSSGAFSTVEQNGVGKGGNVRISADSLSFTNGAQLTASTFGKGDAGNVIIDARGNVSFDGTSSGALSTVAGNGVGKGGDVRISADSLSVTNGAVLRSDTSGQGDAGNIEIHAKNFVSVKGISLSGGFSSGLFTSTDSNSTGIGGNITVNTPLLRVSDGAVLDARTANNRNGGNITLNVKQGEFLNGGQLIATSSGAGNAGKITVNATDRVIVSGSDRTLNQRLEKFGRDAVDPVDASSGLFVRSQSTGSAGDIEVNSPQIRLDPTFRTD